MYVKRVPTVLSLSQLDGEGLQEERHVGPRSLVSQCAFQKLTKISVKSHSEQRPPRIRSFGELSELEDLAIDDYDSESAEDCSVHLKIAVPEEEKSLIELTMVALWESCAARGLFRYDVTACSTKTLPGLYGFLVQLNEGRATKKRPTEFRVDQVLQPFDESKFNFTKALMQEVLFQFDTQSPTRETEIDADATAGRSPDLIMINVSPIEYGHVLLVPRALDRLVQIIDVAEMKLALQFTAAIGNPYFRLGYNSLGAYATINHLHFQGYYLMAPYPVERAPTVPSGAAVLYPDAISVSELVGYPVRGWVFEMKAPFEASLQPMAESVAHICKQLQQWNIPHNLLICDCGARVFLWPQCYAEKQASGKVPDALLATGVNPAVFEIAGHVILKNRQDYDEMTQMEVWRLLSEVSLMADRFHRLTLSF